jgi:hypothetical protein
MQHVSGHVECEVLLQLVDGGELILLSRLRQLLNRRVGTGDIGGVMLVMVQLKQVLSSGAREPRGRTATPAIRIAS